jgi:hypothetical protein
LLRVLHAEHELSDHFIAYMLARNIRVEEDLIDQLFNSSEKRLARTLLLLARYGEADQPLNLLPKVSHGRNYAIAGKFLHEQIQGTRLYRIERKNKSE